MWENKVVAPGKKGEREEDRGEGMIKEMKQLKLDTEKEVDRWLEKVEVVDNIWEGSRKRQTRMMREELRRREQVWLGRMEEELRGTVKKLVAEEREKLEKEIGGRVEREVRKVVRERMTGEVAERVLLPDPCHTWTLKKGEGVPIDGVWMPLVTVRPGERSEEEEEEEW
jgi:hypothetical protein